MLNGEVGFFPSFAMNTKLILLLIGLLFFGTVNYTFPEVDKTKRGYEELFIKGATYYATGEYQKAIPLLVEATQSGYGDERAWFFLGSCYSVVGNTEKAIKAYQKAIGIKPDFVEAYDQLVSAYREVGKRFS